MGTDTTRQRNETWNDNVSHMLAKGETRQGRTARGSRVDIWYVHTWSRPALSNYQMDSAAEIAGYYLLAACEMTLLVSRYSGRFLPPPPARERTEGCLPRLRARQTVRVQVRLSWDNKNGNLTKL